MKKILLSILAVFLLTTGTMSAYVERNMLRNQADEAKLKTLLIPNQKWVPFPAYSDRAGWDALLGDWKDDLIARGEDALNYEWRVVTATDYLTHDRGGSQGEAGANINSNVMKIVDLFFAELATGQGRYINKMANGAFTMGETSTWVLSHHLYLQKTAHHFPQLFDNAIDLVCGDVGSVMAWVFY